MPITGQADLYIPMPVVATAPITGHVGVSRGAEGVALPKDLQQLDLGAVRTIQRASLKTQLLPSPVLTFQHPVGISG